MRGNDQNNNNNNKIDKTEFSFSFSLYSSFILPKWPLDVCVVYNIFQWSAHSKECWFDSKANILFTCRYFGFRTEMLKIKFNPLIYIVIECIFIRCSSPEFREFSCGFDINKCTNSILLFINLSKMCEYDVYSNLESNSWTLKIDELMDSLIGRLAIRLGSIEHSFNLTRCMYSMFAHEKPVIDIFKIQILLTVCGSCIYSK